MSIDQPGPIVSASPSPPDAASHPTTVAVLLTLVACSIVGARILAAPGAFSPNDQSRWSTIRALVETGSYSIGYREQIGGGRYRDMGIISFPGWHTLDAVLHPETGRFYSSKPTLLPTVVAGEYWLLRNIFEQNLRSDRLVVTRTILLTINLLPFAVYLLLLARILDRLGTSTWGKLFVFSTAAFGTFVSGFLASLNNHTVAATAVLFALYSAIGIHLGDDRRPNRFFLAGLFAGWTMCNELPAASFAVGVMLWMFTVRRRETVRYAVPALLIPVAGYLLTQYLSLGTIVPTYAYESWYRYPGSYWLNPGGLDDTDEPKIVYALNLLAGHTGILSLTPALLLGWIGMVRSSRIADTRRADALTPLLGRFTLALTAITYAFYVIRTSNYGGATAGPRWFIWLVPLWLLTMIPEADRWASDGRRRRIAYALLAVSIGSASYALVNPWRSSWLLEWFRTWEIVAY